MIRSGVVLGVASLECAVLGVWKFSIAWSIVLLKDFSEEVLFGEHDHDL